MSLHSGLGWLVVLICAHPTEELQAEIAQLRSKFVESTTSCTILRCHGRMSVLKTFVSTALFS